MEGALSIEKMEYGTTTSRGTYMRRNELYYFYYCKANQARIHEYLRIKYYPANIPDITMYWKIYENIIEAAKVHLTTSAIMDCQIEIPLMKKIKILLLSKVMRNWGKKMRKISSPLQVWKQK
ncbi:unnamed protein product [Blepharisma stoltei]|uniref:Uncharacterized protein n=1 Tax=Blepharisma stoltei TaxID=1481888 RepID=A0AAU9IBJ3_9CILI|nr:unnamed protein product [Blepharisma stoltei]